MKNETKTIIYDDDLKIEAYCFEGIVQPFPNHFHEYYVIGIIEDGKRQLICNNHTYEVCEGNILIFNPKDKHSCTQDNQQTFHYKAINIPQSIMIKQVEKICGKQELIKFSKNVINDIEMSYYLKSLYKMILNKENYLKKEETFTTMLKYLIQKYGISFDMNMTKCSDEINKACEFMKKYYYQHITLEDICEYCYLSQSTLLRAFTKEKGITPYKYLETIRINKATEMLKSGMTPVDTAIHSGFTDQSHFTHHFHNYIGITPGMYYDIFKETVEEDNER
jgi:AraC-like DNA-binding protein